MWNYYLLIPLLLSLANAQSIIRLPSDEVCPSSDPALNDRPVIGILTHPGDGASGRLSNETGISYIAASYVKFVEAAGARVIPLIYNEHEAILHGKLDLVNGVLLTGGRERGGRYYEAIKDIYNRTIEKNEDGDHFPLFAISLGFELLSVIVSKEANVVGKLETKNQAPLLQFFKDDSNFEGTVFQSFPPELLKKLSTDCIISQTDSYGVSLGRFQEVPDLRRFFNILSISTDVNYKPYVSTVKAVKYPITGFQWHPQKNAFEWGSSAIPHSEDAIKVTQLTANYFISEARKSSNKPSAKKVLDYLIYNYSPTYSGKAGKGYDEVYLFPKPRF